MGKNNMSRPETVVHHLTDTMPAAATTNYTLDIEAGEYLIAIFVKANLTGTTTTVAARHWVDKARTQVGTGNSGDLRMFRPLDGTAVASLAFPAGASGQVGQLTNNTATIQYPIVIAHGLQITITKGGASTGEVFELDVVVCKRV